MLKKITTVTALSAAILFGGTVSTADASATSPNVENNHNYTKVYYKIGGKWQSISEKNTKTTLQKHFPNCNWSLINWEKEEKTERNEETKQEQNEEEKPEQKDTTPNKPEEQKPEQDKPVQEKPEVQKPVQEEADKQAEEQTEDKKQGNELNQFEQQVVELTNQERTKRGLKAFKINNELSKVAREKSRDMAVNGYFSHNSPTYGSPFDMMKKYGITYRTAGENIAKGQRTPQRVVQAWMNSEGHRKNILNPNFTEIGVGYIEQGNVWTQQFIGK